MDSMTLSQLEKFNLADSEAPVIKLDDHDVRSGVNENRCSVIE